MFQPSNDFQLSLAWFFALTGMFLTAMRIYSSA